MIEKILTGFIVDQIYSWSNYTPPSNVKVVILGQGTKN